MEPLMLEEVQRLVDVLDVSAKTGEPIEINGYVKRTTLNIILTILFGIHYPQSVNDKESLEILACIHKNVVNATKPLLSDYIPFLRPLLEGKPKYYFDDWSKLLTWVESIVNKRIETFDINEEPKDILDDMLIHHHHGRISLPAIASACLDMILAGSDTSANTILYLITAMVNNPKIQHLLGEELDTTFKGTAISTKDKSSTSYTNAIIKETLRRYPVAPLGVPHQVNEDVMFSGYLIKKGTQVIQNLYASCLSPKIWEDPLTFNPSRFIGEDNPNANKYKMVFGTGVRNCIGTALAESNSNGGPLSEEGVFGLTLSPHPFKVNVKHVHTLSK
eukprot:gene3801-4382_t